MKGRVLNSINSLQSHRVEDLFLVAHDELVESLEKSLHEGIVKFEYVKVSDNSVRQAFGTLKGELIPNKADKIRSDAYIKLSEKLLTADDLLKDGLSEQEKQDRWVESQFGVLGILNETDAWFKKEGEKKSKPKLPDTVVYFDLEAQAFRSFKKENLISVYA